MTRLFFFITLAVIFIDLSCKSKNDDPIVQSLSDLKRGEIISCSPQGGEVYGTVTFPATVPENLQAEFNSAIALLHSFEYDESEKMFVKIIDQDPGVAIAYWGIAMANFHPLWAPPSKAELKKGAEAIRIAKSLKNQTKRESDYIHALSAFYDNDGQFDHRTRVLNFEKRMEAIYTSYPDDKEAAVFYALALNAAADPMDKAYTRQKKAVNILQPIFDNQPLHPGIAHYIIHNCDNPELAPMALPAARKYASIAPSSAHAQHMPSHIFTRLGLWEESVSSNLVSAYSAKCYAEKARLDGHWDEELHAMDYLVYSYLQRGDDDSAKIQVDYLKSINKVYPLNFKTAYAFSSIPARYMLERKQWKEAAAYRLHPVAYPWEKFSWQKSIYHFTRLLGAVHTENLQAANHELEQLRNMHAALLNEKEKQREVIQVDIQIKTGEAWIEFKNKNSLKAVEIMTKAADMEDAMEKHPVTPGEVIPARELLAEMLLQLNKADLALKAFEQDLKIHPNRFNALYGAGLAARQAGDVEKSKFYFSQLIQVADSETRREELKKAKRYLQ